MIGFLAWSARRGSALLGFGVFAGLLIPPLAHGMHWFITPNVVSLMTLVLLRIDIPAALAHLRRADRLALIVAFHLLVCPLVAWAVIQPLHLDPGIASGVVIFATGCAATSGAAFARLVGLDPELTLLATLATTLLVPLSAPPLAYALMGVDLAISLEAFMLRLALAVGVPLLLSLIIRRLAGPARLAPYGQAIDGAVVWLVVLYGFGVMDGLAARLLADPAWVLQATLAAFAADFGLNLVTTVAFLGMGKRAAASAGLMSGNRNMALYLAILPAAADPRIALFFALCQFPLFLSPFLLRRFYAAWIRS
jgi:BASS family bile acid:Na+ symporter